MPSIYFKITIKSSRMLSSMYFVVLFSLSALWSNEAAQDQQGFKLLWKAINSEFEPQICDKEAHNQAMARWDQSVNDANNLFLHLTSDKPRGLMGVKFPQPMESVACLSQYGSLYAERYARLIRTLSSAVMSPGRPGCVYCCECCYWPIGQCGVCCI